MLVRWWGRIMSRRLSMLVLVSMGVSAMVMSSLLQLTHNPYNHSLQGSTTLETSLNPHLQWTTLRKMQSDIQSIREKLLWRDVSAKTMQLGHRHSSDHGPPTSSEEEAVHELATNLDSIRGRGANLGWLLDAMKVHLSESVEFRPLKVMKDPALSEDHIYYHFLSLYKGRGWQEGPPELFIFPSPRHHDPISLGRLLCIRGNNTSNGAQNFYGFAHPEALPPSASLVPGTTLITETSFDFINPWHSMFNLLQFLFWRMDNSIIAYNADKNSDKNSTWCPVPSNLLLFHLGEYRATLGPWVSHLLRALSIPTSVLRLNSSTAPVCFQRAVVSRVGIGGMKGTLRRRMFDEARCRARSSCNVVPSLAHHPMMTANTTGIATPRHVNITLVMRTGGRRFLDEEAWKRVVGRQCETAGDCSWSAIYIGNLTFCEQVQAMSYTDILVSAHGAQLTNIIFMSPGRRIMEIFPGGWLEYAGQGQYVYKNLVSWIGLHHEGFWRDPSTTPCPNPNDFKACCSYYKNQPIGLNETHIGTWLASVISKFKATPLPGQPTNTCECPN